MSNPLHREVSKAMLQLKTLESPDFTEVVVYSSYIYKLRAKWLLQSMAEWHCQRQERGMLKLEAMNALELSPWMK
ncbi:Developmental pluripotency-associated 5 protein [Saguinus oedipus]|uniref:Developmental pluripotency-associated 5 protein n=1 Tax=Saguinus oedipus TaxID=9490 RepID=A0ABQ9U8T6_SAGOE|nr:Developmental pluripotency-associated 5 protein [Saguinus oedipus]